MHAGICIQQAGTILNVQFSTKQRKKCKISNRQYINISARA